jgi:hypothetical protein
MGLAGGNRLSVGYMKPIVGPAQWFPSCTAAAKALGLDQGVLSMIFNKDRAKTAPNANGKRFAGIWYPNFENLQGEEWKEVFSPTRNRLLVSNYGRLQWIYPGGRMRSKHFPETTDRREYFTVGIKREQKLVHRLVGELFFVGPYPLGWKIWDHKDQDKRNNHISNLHPVTVEVNNTNTAQQRDFYLWPVGKPDDWVRCVSQNSAGRKYGFSTHNLNSLLHKRQRKDGYIAKTVGGYCAAFCDEVDSVES